jgi:hypothetical protein
MADERMAGVEALHRVLETAAPECVAEDPDAGGDEAGGAGGRMRCAARGTASTRGEQRRHGEGRPCDPTPPGRRDDGRYWQGRPAPAQAACTSGTPGKQAQAVVQSASMTGMLAAL